MKVFQIVDNFCHWDATAQFPCLQATVGRFPPTDIFVEAPDKVYEGWGYDPTAEGDERFIQPEPPAGWLYDEGTGAFYPECETAPSKQPTADDRIASLEAENKALAAKLSAAIESNSMLEECLVEMAGVVYA